MGYDGHVLLRCFISLGMFASERRVRVQSADGRMIYAFVDNNDVQVEAEPRPGDEVPGYVKVYVLKENKNSVIADLPQPSIAHGTRVEVPKSLFA